MTSMPPTGYDSQNMSDNWLIIDEHSPPDDIIVWTKIDDEKGPRNIQQLIRIKRLWWHTDKKIYVYYSPTHWKSV